MSQKRRARALGLLLAGTPGPHDAITDVPGVRVGHTTLIRGEGPVRTGVTLPGGHLVHHEMPAAIVEEAGTLRRTATDQRLPEEVP